MSKKLIINFLVILSNFAGYKVNFIAGYKLFKTFFKTLWSNVKCHVKKPSSIYLLNNS